jgi:DNA-binding NarL/FixJ family response regulator
MKIKVLIVDDQELFASGIEIILKRSGGEELTVVGIARNGKEAISAVESLRPDVILMDVRMPVMDGVQATRVIHAQYPEIKIMILTTFDDDQYVLDALSYGAFGYVLKNIKPEELVMSIQSVHAGNFFVCPSVGHKLVRQAHKSAQLETEKVSRLQGEVNFLLSHFESLSHREAEILQVILQDFDNREIAERLGIAEQTVKNHISAIYDKLDVPDRVHAKKLVKSRLAKSVQVDR